MIVDAEAGIADLVAPERRADLIDNVFELLVDHRIDVDLEQQVRTAPEIEAEIDRLARNEGRQAGKHLGRQEVRNREQQPDQAHADHQNDLPDREIHHGLKLPPQLVRAGKAALLAARHLVIGGLVVRRTRFGLVVLGLLVALHRRGGLALAANIGEGGFNDPDAHVIGQLDLNLVVVDHLGDLADHAAGGDDDIAAAHRVDHRLVFLLALLLRPDQQEIEDAEHEGQHDEEAVATGALRTCRLGISRRRRQDGHEGDYRTC